MNAIRLKKLPPSWAITGRGNKVSLPAYIILMGGIEIGRISSFYRSQGGGRGWMIDKPAMKDHKHYLRADAVRAVVNHAEALQ